MMKNTLKQLDKKRNTRGITLIALVVTIVVLLILAGVTISMLRGENGIIKQAQNANEATIVEQEKEAIVVAYSLKKAQRIGSYVTAKDLQDELIKNGKNVTVKTSGNNLVIKFNDTNHSYKIDQNGNVEKEETSNNTDKIYAKLYTDNTLILSSTDYTDSTRTVSEDYGDISNEKYYLDLNSKFNNPEINVPKWIDVRGIDGHPALYNKADDIIIYDEIKPKTLAFWFASYSGKTLDLTNIDTSNAESMKGTFYNCDGLEQLDINNFDTSNVTDMSCMFRDCGYTAMTSLTLPESFNTSKVEKMQEMFMNCGYTAMTSLTLPESFNTSKVTNMESMFSNCGYTAMTELKLPEKFNTSKVTNMEYMFNNCGGLKLETIDLGGMSFDNVTNSYAIFCNTGGNKVYVKDKAAQTFVKANKSSSWSDNNIIIKTGS